MHTNKGLISIYDKGARYVFKPQSRMRRLARSGRRREKVGMAARSHYGSVHEKGVIIEHFRGDLPVNGQRFQIVIRKNDRLQMFQSRLPDRFLPFIVDIAL